MSEIHTNRLKWAFYRGGKYNAAYVGATKIFPSHEPESECYAIADTLAEYTGNYPWLWVESKQKWYRRNNQGSYEEYGIYANSIEPYEVITVTTFDNEFNTGAYYVSDHKAVGNTRIVVDFTTPNTFPSSTTMLIGGRTGSTATYTTNIGYSKDGVLRVDAGQNTFQSDTYTFNTNTRYIVEYRTYGTSLRYIVMDANGNILVDKTLTFSGSQRTNVNLGINTMMQPTAYASFTQHSIIRSVKMYNIESVNDEGTLTDNYVFLGDGVCLNTITGYRAVISGGTATYTPSGSYEYAIGTTTYNGKLAIVNGVEYEFTNNQWTLVPSKDYDVCTAIFDGASYYDTGFLAGMPRRYTAIWKPDNTEDSIGVFGTYTEDNAQAVFMDGNTGEGAQNRYSFGKTTLNLGGPVDTSTELWEKIIISSTKPSSYSKQSGWVLYTGSTYNGTWEQITGSVDTRDFTNVDTHNSYIGALNKDDSMYLPFKGEFHSIQIQDSTNQSGNPWSMERDFVFIEINGNVQAYDKVNNTLYSNLGSGVVTKGTTYDSISIQGKQYEPKEPPQNPIVFETIEEMDSYGCAFEGMKAIVNGDEYTYTNGVWVVDDVNALVFTANGTQNLSMVQEGGGDTPVSLEYSLNGRDWATWDLSAVSFGNGVKLYIRGTGNTGFSTGNGIGKHFVFGYTSKIAVSGNIMHLLDYQQNLTEIPTNWCFSRLFVDCSAISDISKLQMPATVLTERCYNAMFRGCTSIVDASGLVLPAMTLTPYCYVYMFGGCTSLTVPPELPATTLAGYCYSSILDGCTALVDASPLKLPASNLIGYCYAYIFNGCKALKRVRVEGDITTIPTDALRNWFNTVPSGGTLYCKQSLANILPNGASGKPTGWSVQVI